MKINSQQVFFEIILISIFFMAFDTFARPKIDTFLSSPPICFCVSANAGIGVSGYHTLGINYYSGLVYNYYDEKMMGGWQSGIFLRSHPWSNSFFVTTRLGWLQVKSERFPRAHDAPLKKESTSGMSAGIDIGNRWFYKSGFTQGFTWIGSDFFLAMSKIAGFPHGFRYEIGWRF